MRQREFETRSYSRIPVKECNKHSHSSCSKKQEDAVLKIAKEYLDGKMSRIDCEPDIPCEVEKRYQKMLCFYLVENNTDRVTGLPDKAFCEQVRKQYLNVLDDIH